MMVPKKKGEKKGFGNRFLDFVEKVGNKLPHPMMLFFILAALVLVFSLILSSLNVAVEHPVDGSKVEVINLLNADGIRDIFTKAVDNFVNFAPLGVVLVAMLGVGVAEKTGLIPAALKKLILGAPHKLVTVVVVLAGILSNVAADAGYVVVIPLGAIVFAAKGRHPIAGLAAAFAGVSGGFSANLVPSMLDPMLAGFTEDAIVGSGLVDEYSVSATANLLFMMVSTFLITIVGTLVTEKIVEPRLGEYKGDYVEKFEPLTERENKGLKYSLIGIGIFVAGLLVMLVPESGILRGEDGAIITAITPFMNSMIPLIALMFLLPALFYGKVAGTIKSNHDVANYMGKSMADMGGYIALAFAASQFVSYFNWSQIGSVISISGANFLQWTGIDAWPIPLILAFILVCAIINIFIGSATAKWGIMAPVFVPMLYLLGTDPEVVQLAYRIGDSTTNIISPLLPYFAFIIAFAQKYDKNLGIGTLVSTMLPYSIAFTISWMILLTIWLLLGIPVGF
ncbi:AbgT family transporter [Proteinivorax hydrogeniformans]|uniref:AbgT family transporter n=1 Tax=Proteinivorax hydrogeniformans TaxID=1826727 RepID=A0AAU8HQY3_9FIRM